MEDNHEQESSKTCEICQYEGDVLEECLSCKMMLCGDCHNAHADDIQFDGECHPDWI